MTNSRNKLSGIELLERLNDSYANRSFPETPLPLPEEDLVVPTMDPPLARELLPCVIADYASDFSTRTGVPIESIAFLCISALGGILGRQIAVKPKKYDDWYEYPNLWATIVARPSEKKSATLTEALRGVMKLENDAYDDFKYKETEIKTNVIRLNAQKNAIEERIQENSKSNTTTPDDLLIEHAQVLNEISGIQKDPLRFKTNDATIEKLGELLSTNQNGLIVIRDELSGFLAGLEKPGREQDRAFYLESWSGKNSFRFDRVSRETINIPALCLTLIGTIQPDKLNRLVSETTAGSGGDGFLQRFQLLIYPLGPREAKFVDQEPNRAVAAEYLKLFKNASKLDLAKFSHTLLTENMVPAMCFDAPGYQLYKDWTEKLEQRLVSGEFDTPALESHFGKYRSLMPCLALLCHLVEHLSNGTESKSGIDEASTQKAIAMCSFLEPHAERVYSLSRKIRGDGAKTLLSRIRSRNLYDGMSLRELERKGWSGLTSKDQLKEALDLLNEHGYLKIESVFTDGPPKKVIRLHPKLAHGS